MPRYAFHDLTLEVEQTEGGGAEELGQFLHELFWDRTRAAAGLPSLSLQVGLGDGRSPLPLATREVLRTEDFRGLENGRDFYLTDGASLLHLDTDGRRGVARLAPSFFLKSPLQRRDFWVFGLLRLLRPMGLFALHAAGVVAPDGGGVLVVGESGSGKSTLTIALVRGGWRYLSDDAVLLRRRTDDVEALALRRHFYVDGAAVDEYADLPLGEEKPDRNGGLRKRVAIEAAYPAQRAVSCTPRVLLFPRVVSGSSSALIAVDRVSALSRLIAQSGTQLLERSTMEEHLDVLKALLQQARAYELQAGSDLHREPRTLVDLLARAEKGAPCPASSSS